MSPSPDIEYSSIQWGEESLTLLCPVGVGGAGGGEEPYVIVSELVQKVLEDRSHVNVQQRNKLGVAVIPASSLQIHALRARGTLDSSAGKHSDITERVWHFGCGLVHSVMWVCR